MKFFIFLSTFWFLLDSNQVKIPPKKQAYIWYDSCKLETSYKIINNDQPMFFANKYEFSAFGDSIVLQGHQNIFPAMSDYEYTFIFQKY